MATGKVYIYDVAMPDYEGANHGEPLPGDLAAVILSPTEPSNPYPGLIWIEES